MSCTPEITTTHTALLLCFGGLLATLLLVIYAITFEHELGTDIEMVPDCTAV
jgi:hypothetical protein